MPDVDPVAERLRQEREVRGLTRQDVARLAGIPQSTLVDYEKGSSLPSLRRLRTWAGVFGLDLDLVEAPTETTSTEEDDHG